MPKLFAAIPRLVIGLLVSLVLAVASPVRATIIDAINGSAAPAGNLTNSVYWSFPGNDCGWYYTAPLSYYMTGISTDFSPSNSTEVTPTITMQIQTDRPANGGTVLAQGTFVGNSGAGGMEGISFNPVLILAGHTYFIDLENMNGMGVDLGTWQNVGGTPEPSGGATTSLGAYYYDATTSTTTFSSSSSNVFGVSTSGVNVGGAEPIFSFSGSPVPEPSAIALFATFVVLAGAFAVRRIANRRVPAR